MKTKKIMALVMTLILMVGILAVPASAATDTAEIDNEAVCTGFFDSDTFMPGEEGYFLIDRSEGYSGTVLGVFFPDIDIVTEGTFEYLPYDFFAAEYIKVYFPDDIDNFANQSVEYYLYVDGMGQVGPFYSDPISVVRQKEDGFISARFNSGPYVGRYSHLTFTVVTDNTYTGVWMDASGSGGVFNAFTLQSVNINPSSGRTTWVFTTDRGRSFLDGTTIQVYGAKNEGYNGSRQVGPFNSGLIYGE